MRVFLDLEIDKGRERIEAPKVYGFPAGFLDFPAFLAMNGDKFGIKHLPLVVLYMFVSLVINFG